MCSWAATSQKDCPSVDPTPASFRTALREVIRPDDNAPILQTLAQRDERIVVMVDDSETIDALDGWLWTRTPI